MANRGVLSSSMATADLICSPKIRLIEVRLIVPDIYLTGAAATAAADAADAPHHIPAAFGWLHVPHPMDGPEDAPITSLSPSLHRALMMSVGLAEFRDSP
jgi:hypothetical protein